MIFKQIILCLTFLLLFSGFQSPFLSCKYSEHATKFISKFKEVLTDSYSEIFGDDYQDALNYFRENKTLHKKVLNKNKVDADIIIPVVFPERIRYSIVRDYFETLFLESVYKDFGSEYVDFSVGDFQMKPSFIEKLELEIERSDSLCTKYSYLLIKKSKPAEERSQRLKNLKSTVYQLNYICAFNDIVNLKFNLSEMTNTEKIKFIASAYNYGFDKSKNDISEHINVKFFPYGSKYPGKQYAYTDVAVDFYINYYSTI